MSGPDVVKDVLGVPLVHIVVISYSFDEGCVNACLGMPDGLWLCEMQTIIIFTSLTCTKSLILWVFSVILLFLLAHLK